MDRPRTPDRRNSARQDRRSLARGGRRATDARKEKWFQPRPTDKLREK